MRTPICIPVCLWYDLAPDGRVSHLELELPDGEMFDLPADAAEIEPHIWVSGGWAHRAEK